MRGVLIAFEGARLAAALVEENHLINDICKSTIEYTFSDKEKKSYNLTKQIL